MSINNLMSELEAAAWSALEKAGAIKACPFHPDVTIRIGNDNAERHACAIGINEPNSDGATWSREEMTAAIEEELEMAADGVCPQCADLMDSDTPLS